MTATRRLLVCAKSRWDPPIRREHSLAMAAARAGWQIDLVEQPYDVRDLRSRPETPDLPAGITLSSYFTPVPGHRNELARRVDAFALRRSLRRIVRSGPSPEAVVVNAPWAWDGTAGLPRGTRRVLDLADDWAALLPRRRDLIHRAYQKIAAEADEIVVVAPTLAELFDRPVTVVANGVGARAPVDTRGGTAGPAADDVPRHVVRASRRGAAHRGRPAPARLVPRPRRSLPLRGPGGRPSAEVDEPRAGLPRAASGSWVRWAGRRGRRARRQ